MTVGRDYLGNPVSTVDAALLAAVDDFVGGFLAYENRAASIVRNAAAAPDCALVNAYAGALFMLLESTGAAAAAGPFLERAEAANGGNARERAFIDFLRTWHDGDIPTALNKSEAIAAAWPRDLVAVKLHQYLTFQLGDAPAMLRIALGSAAHCADIPHIHGMVAFGFEQCHLLGDAERSASRALQMTEREPWAQHALAHVMLTQGRIDEGERFMARSAATWTDLNSFMVTHNWWHLALFRLSQGRWADVLAIYDDQCWAHDRDYSQDQIGAVSLLARLELAGFDIGERWSAVADRLVGRGPDVEQAFLSLHYLYGLARAGRAEADALLDAFRDRARAAPAFCRATWADVALPMALGIVAWLGGRPDEAVRHMDLAMPNLAAIGGSHAQRDLFHQIRLAALVDAGRWVDVQQILELRRATEPGGVSLNRQLARAYDALGLPDQASAARITAEAALSRLMN